MVPEAHCVTVTPSFQYPAAAVQLEMSVLPVAAGESELAGHVVQSTPPAPYEPAEHGATQSAIDVAPGREVVPVGHCSMVPASTKPPTRTQD